MCSSNDPKGTFSSYAFIMNNKILSFCLYVCTPVSGESYRRQLGSVLLRACDVFLALFNSVVGLILAHAL